MANRQVVVAGPHVLCYVNATLIGRVTSFSLNSKTGFRGIRGIDIPTVQEHAPTITEVAFQLGLLRTRGDGGAQGAGLVVQQPDISRAKYFTVLLVDRRTDMQIFKADFCVANDESWSLDARGRMVGTVSCEGVTWSNEVST